MKTSVCQPALFVHGMALWTLLEEAGRTESITTAMGLSLGEVTALTAAAVFDFETGLRVVAERARLMQLACDQFSGTMASVLGEELARVEDLCREFDIEIANLNCPGQIVISGTRDKVGAAVEAARQREFKRVVPLNVAGAYHSRLMEPARAAFAAFLAGVEFKKPRLLVISNTTAEPVEHPDVIREALARQVVSPVLWEQSLRRAAALGAADFLELGPGGVLGGLLRRTDRSWPVKSLAEFADLNK